MSGIDWEQQLDAYRRTVLVAEEAELNAIPTHTTTADKQAIANAKQIEEEERLKAQAEQDVINAERMQTEIKKAWQEFKGPKGPLFFNMLTHQVRMSSMDEQPVSMGKEHELMTPENLRAYYSGESKKGKDKGNENAEMRSVERVVEGLSLIESTVQGILGQAQHLSSTIVEDLRTIKKSVRGIHEQLEAGDAALDERTDVQYLCNFNNLKWDFNSFHVEHYRAQAVAEADHSSYTYKDWHLPQYFSEFPLPVGLNSTPIDFVLPRTGPGEDPDTYTMTVRDTDTVSHVINEVLAKNKSHEGLQCSPSEYVLKIVGLTDFLVGENRVFSYEAVRYQLRNMIKVKLGIQLMPQPTADDFKEIQTYRGQANQKVQLMGTDDHVGLACRDFGSWHELEAVGRLPMSDMSVPFRFKVEGLDDVGEQSLPRLDDATTHLYVQSFLFYGTHILPDTEQRTEITAVSVSPRWSQWLRGGQLNNIPRGARLGVILWGESSEKEEMLGWAVKQLVDEYGYLASGPSDIKLWAFPGHEKGKHGKKRELDHTFLFRATNRDNHSDERPVTLRVQFDEFPMPVVAPMSERYRDPNPRVVGGELDRRALASKDRERLDFLLRADPLFKMSPADNALLWRMRHSLVKTPSMLPRLLGCVDWANKEFVFEAHRLLELWTLPKEPSVALELLEAKFPDIVVREYAVKCLTSLTDEELRTYLLQLVQCLKFEPYHNNALTRFLLKRSIQSPFEVGHHFFWHLKAELHDPHFSERFGLVIEEYLSHCGNYSHELRKQSSAVLKLQRVAEMIVKLKREHGYADEDAMREYTKEIKKLNRDFFKPMGKFQIPLNPKLEATTLIVEKCRYMSSKMVPLWLVFKNADPNGDNIYIIFKSGDDLRQDILTLQLLSVMDRIWLGAGLDMKMKPYKCIATGVNDHGEGVGMIEVVLNSDTTSGIQLKYGGGAMGALKMDPIDLFIHDNNKGDDLYEQAVDNFICSCAGYCVATYVLGIGDRHNGNIMVTKDGHLFHIDFGHFLGNFKKKFGVNRERAAFVFTPEMAYVMGGKKYKKSAKFKRFQYLCSQGYKILRQNAAMLEDLFIMMQSAGMPELMVEDDILYMRDRLCLDVSAEEADQILKDEITKSLGSTYRRVDNAIHNFKHG